LFENFSLLQKSVSGFPMQLQNCSNALLGNEIENVPGCTIGLLLDRLQPMDLQQALENCTRHFSKSGTVAQRIRQNVEERMGWDLTGTQSQKEFTMRSMENLDNCKICFSSIGNQLTMCGHGFCKDCSKMLKVGISISCPVCRSALSDYDWFDITESQKQVHEPSKIIKLRETIATLKQKQRKKNLYVFASEQVQENLHKLFKEDKNVIVKPFESIEESLLKEETLSSNIVFASPAGHVKYYYSLIKCANARNISIQLYLLYAMFREDISEAQNTFLTINEPRRKQKIAT
jgi:hypothetical protein